MMDIVLVFNGLGNQMSQYAFYLAKKNTNYKCRVLFDIASNGNHNGFELQKIFGINFHRSLFDCIINFLIRAIRKFRLPSLMQLLGIRTINEPLTYIFDRKYLEEGGDFLTIYFGGWHSEKYFKDIRHRILEVYKFPKIIPKTNDDMEYNRWLDTIMKDDQSVSVHVRRGDYLTESVNSAYQYHICSLDYYLHAFEYILKRFQTAKFYVFSNDMEWCKRNIHMDGVFFVSCNKGENSWRDMSLMSQCRHHIVANSSFSWWGAWLSPHDGITVRPERFLNNHDTPDYYPETWISME